MTAAGASNSAKQSARRQVITALDHLDDVVWHLAQARDALPDPRILALRETAVSLQKRVTQQHLGMAPDHDNGAVVVRPVRQEEGEQP